MRISVTLDPDIAARLKAIARRRGVSFREALNSAVRAGLGRESRLAPQSFTPYTQIMGLRPGVDLDKTLRLATVFEDEAIVRQLQRRK
jgi:hypothetical protein